MTSRKFAVAGVVVILAIVAALPSVATANPNPTASTNDWNIALAMDWNRKPGTQAAAFVASNGVSMTTCSGPLHPGREACNFLNRFTISGTATADTTVASTDYSSVDHLNLFDESGPDGPSFAEGSFGQVFQAPSTGLLSDYDLHLACKIPTGGFAPELQASLFAMSADQTTITSLVAAVDFDFGSCPTVATFDPSPTVFGWVRFGFNAQVVAGESYAVLLTAAAIGGNQPSISPTAVTAGSFGSPTVGVPISVTVSADGSPAPTFAVTAGLLPDGLVMDPVTGVISGTPTTAGPFTFTITATNDAGEAATQLTGTIIPAAVVVPVVPAPMDLGFVGLTPARLLDTRATSNAYAAGSVHTLTVAGQLGVPADATAVVLNVAVAESTVPGYITVYPCGTTQPFASNGNFAAGETISNAVTTRLGTGVHAGTVCIYSSASTHIVVDVNGAYSPTAGTGLLAGLATPARLYDSRTSGIPVSGGTSLEVAVAGHGGVAAAATSVVLNVTVDQPVDAGFITAYACGTEPPLAANLNFVAGQTVGNSVTVPVGADGRVCLYTMATTHLVVDVTADHRADRVLGHLLATEVVRVFDSRDASGGAAVAGGTVQEIKVAGRDGIPAGISAVTLNAAVDGPSAPGFLTVFPCGVPVPFTSSANFVAAQTVSSSVTTAVGVDGMVCVYTSASTDLIVDVGATFGALAT